MVSVMGEIAVEAVVVEKNYEIIKSSYRLSLILTKV